jgi:hypothetical protein
MKFASVGVLLLTSLIATNLCAKEGYHHFPEVFIGATHADSKTEFTYALEYEYKFTDAYGAGLIYEKVDDAHHGDGVTLKIGMLYYHPVNAVRLGIGAGREEIGGAHPHSEDLVRVSASYDYHFEHFSVAPTVAVDFIDGENALVFGLGFIKPF